MGLTSFCGLLTIQVGVAVLSGIFLTLAAVITITNVFDYCAATDWPANLIIIIFFIVGLVVAALLMFFSSYAEVRSVALIALILIIILTVYWVILCIFAFIHDPGHVLYICIRSEGKAGCSSLCDGRCPQTFWIANLDKYYFNKYKTTKKPTTTKPPKVNKTVAKPEYDYEGDKNYGRLRDEPDYKVEDDEMKTIEGYNYVYDIKMLRDYAYPDEISSTSSEKPKKPTKKKTPKSKTAEETSFAFVGTIIMFIINFIFFLFSAYVMWSWAKELDWADYYVEDEPVVIYEDQDY